jgi:hypothetical protein
MKAFIVFLLFIGVILIIHGISEQKIKAIEKNKRIEYRFIPRTYLEEQISDNNLSGKLNSMFVGNNPWMDRNAPLEKPTKPL